MSNSESIENVEDVHETLDTLYEISTLLETGLDKQTLSILVGLCEAGVNPEALAAAIKELRRESISLGESV